MKMLEGTHKLSKASINAFTVTYNSAMPHLHEVCNAARLNP
jgi:hypothetical protein